MELRHHLYISLVSPNDGLHGPKYIVNEIMRIFV
jgi:hypothetical protein